MKRSNFDFKTYVEDAFDFKPQQMNPDQASIDCINPDCNDNWRRRKKMTVNLADQISFCYVCGKSYNLAQFISTVEGISIGAAILRISKAMPKRTFGSDRLTKALENLRPEKIAEPAITPPEVELPYTQEISPGSAAWDYLHSRNFGSEIIEHFELRYCPFGDYSHRIIIPVYDGDKKLITFQARTIHKNVKPKYLFPKDGSSGLSNSFYNWSAAKLFEEIIFVEGVTDNWYMHKNGFPNVAATLGKSLKQAQLQLLLAEKQIKSAIFFWDGEAKKNAYRYAQMLNLYIPVKVAELPHGQEPDSCPDPGFYLENAIPISSLSKIALEMKIKGLP